MKKTIRYLFLSVFVFVFSQIYEYFSHGVYSNYMLYAFLIPFLGLSVPSFLLHSLKKALPANSRFLWKCGIATLTVGSIYKGILEIYGTNGYFEFPYLFLGVTLCVSAVITCIGKQELIVEREGQGRKEYLES
ncbi:hypothetical protein [Oribacterium asaccharolyticum]|uniref:hypothetical protein n=1 Tax=Oribacterium asaccharolyticum TaxID=1501332 RepID=UPI0028EBD09A|nr:hypothetical protein [Oribacterium asaccharolyticum]